MFTTGVSRPLRARHFLVGDFGDESVPHAHPYRIELVCRSASLDSNGFSTDIAVMESVLEGVLAEIDDVLLNDLPYFARRQPSLENLALYLVEELRARLTARSASPTEPLEIRIWENEDAWAGYRETV
ncbi:MAG: 6-pyruvoyl trahydropterin synthase family protein [Spirochaetota bacterium]